MRKTIRVGRLLRVANRLLGLSLNTPEERDQMVGFRRGVIALIEEALDITGNYRGYQYVSPPGIDNTRGQFDNSLRKYYPPPQGYDA